MADYRGVDVVDRTHNPAWHNIPGFPDYRVNRDGEILSLRSRKTLRPRTRGRYLGVTLYADATRSDFYIHHLVALVFIGPRPDGKEIRHLDDDRGNNRASNLAYGTHAQNMDDAVLNGTHSSASKDTCSHGHPFTESNTYRRSYTDSSGAVRVRRQCRACNARHQREQKARRAKEASS